MKPATISLTNSEASGNSDSSKRSRTEGGEHVDAEVSTDFCEGSLAVVGKVWDLSKAYRQLAKGSKPRKQNFLKKFCFQFVSKVHIPGANIHK